jgi:hypothetical protein
MGLPEPAAQEESGRVFKFLGAWEGKLEETS